MEQLDHAERGSGEEVSALRPHYDLILIAVAAIIFIGCIVSPPRLMDDVDAVHGQIARNMIQSGDWVIPHLDGVPYVEKAPLPYWLIAVCYLILGIHDWVARIPTALAVVLLCWITARYARWAFSMRAGFYAGLSLVTSVGMFLFTRVLIPDVMVALTVCVCFLSFQRALDPDEDESHSRRWAALLAVALGVGMLLKGLIAVVIPVGGAMVYLALTRQIFVRDTWRRLHLVSSACIFCIIAAPWHILATLRMPPYFDFTLHSGPGQYHGFFWFYFINEHLLRFLNLRYPRDYNTVPRLTFWLLNLVWLFPWSVYLPAAARMSYKPVDRAGRARLLALCWAGFVLLFFTFSTTQEYYSMPMYPALALLLGAAMDSQGKWVAAGTRLLGLMASAAAVVVATTLFMVRNMPTPGDISDALGKHPAAYTLALGHLGDLTLQSLAYLRTPLILAGVAFLVGSAGVWVLRGRRVFLALAAMMVLFFHASRLALVVFDPYLSSQPLAEALRQAPQGRLIVDGAYYPFASVLFYADRTALLLNGRVNNLEYGSYAPGANQVFIDDAEFVRSWSSADPCYLVADSTQLGRIGSLVGPGSLHLMAESGGKVILSNTLSAATAGSAYKGESKRALW